MATLRYVPVGHFSGTLTQSIDLTSRIPWVYLIASLGQKIVYVGETFDDAGLAGRLAAHFGRAVNSTFKKCALQHAGIRNVSPPYLVIGARLPFEDDDAPFNGESKLVRKACESVLQEIITSSFVLPNKWTIISSSSSSLEANEPIRSSCDSIVEHFLASYSLFGNLSSDILPVNLILLDKNKPKGPADSISAGDVIQDIELQLYEWILGVLKREFADDWWEKGVKSTIRVACATRHEEEALGGRIPKHAYLTLIDIKAIVESNWNFFSSAMEEVSGYQGKSKALKWIGEINEKRKLWAHPLKQKHMQIEPSSINKMRTYQAKLREAIKNDS